MLESYFQFKLKLDGHLSCFDSVLYYSPLFPYEPKKWWHKVFYIFT